MKTLAFLGLHVRCSEKSRSSQFLKNVILKKNWLGSSDNLALGVPNKKMINTFLLINGIAGLLKEKGIY